MIKPAQKLIRLIQAAAFISGFSNTNLTWWLPGGTNTEIKLSSAISISTGLSSIVQCQP